MKKFTFFLTLAVSFSAPVSSMAGQTKSNTIRGFEYASCLADSCVLIQAPKAFVGVTLDAFSTSGETVLKITNAQGIEKSIYKGTGASLNPQMQTLILDTASGGFVLYSLKDGRITDYSTPTGGGK